MSRSNKLNNYLIYEFIQTLAGYTRTQTHFLILGRSYYFSSTMLQVQKGEEFQKRSDANYCSDIAIAKTTGLSHFHIGIIHFRPI